MRPGAAAERPGEGGEGGVELAELGRGALAQEVDAGDAVCAGRREERQDRAYQNRTKGSESEWRR